ncbi:MAG: hypothetical protein JSR17_06985 [Proteobacteria bacterium]|nr:hypothetical protein [Pseudomonadota bacterium]
MSFKNKLIKKASRFIQTLSDYFIDKNSLNDFFKVTDEANYTDKEKEIIVMEHLNQELVAHPSEELSDIIKKLRMWQQRSVTFRSDSKYAKDIDCIPPTDVGFRSSDPVLLTLKRKDVSSFLPIVKLELAEKYFESIKSNENDVVFISYNQDGKYLVKTFFYNDKLEETKTEYNSREIEEICSVYNFIENMNEVLSVKLKFIYVNCHNYAKLTIDPSCKEHCMLIAAFNNRNLYTKALPSGNEIYIDCAQIMEVYSKNPSILDELRQSITPITTQTQIMRYPICSLL